ncbi:MAG: T9SS type A sorting domain-containing protein [Saprospiraceae bacterium]
MQLKLFPNPVNQQLNIRYYLPEQAPVHVRLLNANGRMMHQFLAINDVGWHENSLTIHHLPIGIYFLSIQTTQQQLYRKVIVQR